MDLHRKQQQVINQLSGTTEDQIDKILVILKQEKRKYLDVLPSYVIRDEEKRYYLLYHDPLQNKYIEKEELDLYDVIDDGIESYTTDSFLYATRKKLSIYNIKTGKQEQIAKLNDCKFIKRGCSISQKSGTPQNTRYLVADQIEEEDVAVYEREVNISRVEYSDEAEGKWIITPLIFYLTEAEYKHRSYHYSYRNRNVEDKLREDFRYMTPYNIYELNDDWILIIRDGGSFYQRQKDNTYLFKYSFNFEWSVSVLSPSESLDSPKVLTWTGEDKTQIYSLKNDQIVKQDITLELGKSKLFSLAPLFLSNNIILEWGSKNDPQEGYEQPVLRIFTRSTRDKNHFSLFQIIDPFTKFEPNRIDDTHFSAVTSDSKEINIWRKNGNGPFVKQVTITRDHEITKFIILPLAETRDKVVNHLQRALAQQRYMKLSKQLVTIVSRFI
jgi:hypothetical protein